MRVAFYFSAVLVFAFVFLFIFFDSKTETKYTADFYNAYIHNVPVHLETAKTRAEWTKGLSGRPSLQFGNGMLFVFDKPGDYGIWMKDMNFNIDILWLDQNMNIVHIVENATPESYPKVFRAKSPASFVVEMGAGFVEENNIKVGDSISIVSAENKGAKHKGILDN